MRSVHLFVTRRKFFSLFCFFVSLLLCFGIYSRYSELRAEWLELETWRRTGGRLGSGDVGEDVGAGAGGAADNAYGDKEPFQSVTNGDSAVTVEPKPDPDVELPPTYERFYEIERNYPQHDVSLPYPEGKDGRFLWISNQHDGQFGEPICDPCFSLTKLHAGLGWNNIFQNLYVHQ